jgi:hypothetical protein
MELALLGGQPVRQKPFLDLPVFGRGEEESLQEVLRSRAWGGYSAQVEDLSDLCVEALAATEHTEAIPTGGETFACGEEA